MSRSSRTLSTASKSPPERSSSAAPRNPRRRPSAGRAQRGVANETSDWHELRPTRVRGLRLTRAGALFAVITVLLCIAALNTESNLLFLVFALCAAGLIINLIVVWRRMRRFSIRRVAPSITTCGRAFSVRYELRANRRFGRTFGVVLREVGVDQASLRIADAFVPAAPAGRGVEVETLGIARRRGLHDLLRVRAESSMPFGLVRRVLEAPLPHRVVAFPRLGRFDRPVLPNGRSAESGSARPQLSRRMPDEFFGLREYRLGDNPHWIHWRRSARTGELFVREMATRQARELLVVVDHRRTRSPDDRERLVSGAATIACDALERGFRVGLIGLAADLVVVAPVAGRSHRERLLFELARLHGEPDASPAVSLQRLRWPTGRGTMAIVLAARDDEAAGAAETVIRSKSGTTRRLTAGTPSFEASFHVTNGNGSNGAQRS